MWKKLTYTGTGNFTGTGNASDNIITGGIGNDTLLGGAGADQFFGGDGTRYRRAMRTPGAVSEVVVNLKTGVHTGIACGRHLRQYREVRGLEQPATPSAQTAMPTG